MGAEGILLGPGGHVRGDTSCGGRQQRVGSCGPGVAVLQYSTPTWACHRLQYTASTLCAKGCQACGVIQAPLSRNLTFQEPCGFGQHIVLLQASACLHSPTLPALLIQEVLGLGKLCLQHSQEQVELQESA